MERLGYGTGAWIGGVLAEHAGYSVTGMLGFSGCMLRLAVGFPSLFRALEGQNSVGRGDSRLNVQGFRCE
jgi:predicted MFS family arabinose efflux permease